MTKGIHLMEPELDRNLHEAWALLRKNNPFKGMTTKEILRKIRSR